MKTYTGKITELKGNQILVDTNATKRGLRDQVYGIYCTDYSRSFKPKVSLEYIISQIRDLYRLARIMSDMEFVVGEFIETKVERYSSKDIAWCFRRAGQALGDLSNAMNKDLLDLVTVSIPRNIIFEEAFSKLVFNIEQMEKEKKLIKPYISSSTDR